ncbi:hypothetical protein RY27_16235 [Litorilinea aerophila]|nr:hypothetical protein RY27_16235 [Litorilinea aerophila]
MTGEESPKRILVVDDAAETRLMLELRFKREGYTVMVAKSGEEALDLVRREGLPSLAVLDILMPGMDGFAVAEALHSMGDVPIIFLSALSDTSSKVEALSRYAEDYLTKPFAFSELLARVRRVLARKSTALLTDTESVIDEQLQVNFAQQYAVLQGRKVPLTPIENRLLRILYYHRGRVLSPGFLMAKAWDPLQKGTVGSLWVHIRRLRSKIEPDPNNPVYLITVRGQGYCLTTPVQEDQTT